MTSVDMLTDLRTKLSEYQDALAAEKAASAEKDVAAQAVKVLVLKLGTEMGSGSFSVDTGDGRRATCIYRPKQQVLPGAFQALRAAGLSDDEFVKTEIDLKKIDSLLTLGKIGPETALKVVTDANLGTTRAAAVPDRTSVYNLKVTEVA